MASTRQAQSASSPQSGWREALAERLALFGHRNWIVVADSAYPAQSCAGIETIVSNEEHIEVLGEVLSRISACRHVRPIVHTDQELEFLEETDAPGIVAFRRQLSGLFKDRSVEVQPHEKIISSLDQAGRIFRVLIIKTNLALPYTSVFLRLDCGYWSVEAETRLRSVMARQVEG